MEIILASASPRRRELIRRIGVPFRVVPSRREEKADVSLPPPLYARTLAEQKAEEVAGRESGIVLGADTIVVLDGRIIGKPKSAEEAVATLRALSGRSHVVITGYCVIYGTFHEKRKTGSVSSTVFFNELTDELIREYVAMGVCMDKAGSYGVQDGFPLVARVEGSLSNVIGLPVEVLTDVLKEIENE